MKDYLSHSQLKLWESDPISWVKWYLFEDSRPNQSHLYARGTAFDLMVKNKLLESLGLKFEPLFDDESGFFDVYRSSGVFDRLVAQCRGVSWGLDVEVGDVDGIPFKGYIDLMIDGVVLDWKTRGVGPTKWYRSKFSPSGEDLGSHVEGCACINPYYVDQLAIYDYCTDKAGVGIIHEVGAWGVTIHKGVLDYAVVDKIKRMAEMVFEKKWFLHNVSFDESQKIVESLRDDVFRRLV